MLGQSQIDIISFLITLIALFNVGSTDPLRYQSTSSSISEGEGRSILDNDQSPDDYLESLDDIHPQEVNLAKAIGKVIAFVVCATILVIVITIVCCCCCPFCILAKRKERGRVLRQGPPTQQQQPTHNPGVVTQQGYTVPTEQYQQQMVPQPYPNAGYNQPVPPSVPYGNQAGPQGFVMDQPPPYPGPPIQQNQMQQSAGGSEYQKQPAFSPNAS